MPDLRFKKSERLKSRKRIGQLFEKGKSLSCFPLLLKYNYLEPTPGLAASTLLKVGFTVSRRSFKRAVDRNRIKRQMREAFRLHKHLFYEKEEVRQIDAMFIYTARKATDYRTIEKASLELLTRLSSRAD